VLLAGGLARRMGGGDKPMRQIGGRTILERVIAGSQAAMRRTHPQRHGDPARFQRSGLPVISEPVKDFLDRSQAFSLPSTGRSQSSGCRFM